MVPSTGRVDRPLVTLSSARVRAPSSTSLTGSATPAPNSCCQRRTGSSPNPVTDSTVAGVEIGGLQGPAAVNALEDSLRVAAVSYTHLRAHETDSYLVCRLLL